MGLLLEAAAEQRADTLIVGASRARVRGLLGSKAVRTVRRCYCPVTVVP